MDLPIEGHTLRHYTRSRPRPNRRNSKPPSKPQVRGNTTITDQGGWGWREEREGGTERGREGGCRERIIVATELLSERGIDEKGWREIER